MSKRQRSELPPHDDVQPTNTDDDDVQPTNTDDAIRVECDVEITHRRIVALHVCTVPDALARHIATGTARCEESLVSLARGAVWRDGDLSGPMHGLNLTPRIHQRARAIDGSIGRYRSTREAFGEESLVSLARAVWRDGDLSGPMHGLNLTPRLHQRNEREQSTVP